MAEEMRLIEVSRSTVAVVDPRLRSNAAAAVFDECIVAVDVGMRPYASRMFRETLERTYRRPVRFVCVTHEHADHTYGLVAFKDAVLFSAHSLVQAIAASDDFAPETLARQAQDDPEGGAWLDDVELVVPQLQFCGRMDLVNSGRTMEFHHSGGHTGSSVWGLLPDEGVLFAGDLIFSGGFPFAGAPTADPEVWMSTLRGWQELPIKHVIPGHGPVGGPAEIDRELELFENLKANVVSAIEAGRGPEGVEIPSVGLAAGMPWFVDRTVSRWYAYYSAVLRPTESPDQTDPPPNPVSKR